MHPLRELTSQTITAPWRLETELADSSLAHSDQEFRYGISCAAAALEGDNTIAALSASYAFTRAHRLRNRVDDLITDVAARISDVIRLAGPYEASHQFDEKPKQEAAI